MCTAIRKFWPEREAPAAADTELGAARGERFPWELDDS